MLSNRVCPSGNNYVDDKLLKERWYLRTRMKAIAKDIVVQNYSIVVTDERVVQEQEENKKRGVHISNDRVRRTIIKERIMELIGDEKKKICFFIYEGTVRHSFIFEVLLLITRLHSVKNIMAISPTER